MEETASALMHLSQTVAENPNGQNDVLHSVTEKPQTVRKRCLVYWVADKLISIEPISAVVKKDQAKEGSVCQIKWKGKGPFLGKVIKISADNKILHEEQEKLEEALLKASGHQEQVEQSPPLEECQSSTRGRKRTKSRKMMEAEENDDVEERVKRHPSKSASPPPKKKAKEAGKEENKLSKLAAKVNSQRALFEQFVHENSDSPLNKTLPEEPPSQLSCNTENVELPPMPYSFTALLNDPEDEGNCFDGVARAVQVLNDDSIMYEDRIQDTNLDEVAFLKKEIERLQWVLREKDLEIEELKLRLAKRTETDNSAGVTRLNGLAVTPKKVKFVRDLSEALSSLMTEKSTALTSPHHQQSNVVPTSTASEVQTSAPSPQFTTVTTANASGTEMRETPRSPDSSGDCDEKVELVKGTGVYVTVAERTGIAFKGKKGLGVMLRKILEVLFSSEELRCGCAVGGRPKAPNRQFGFTSVPLDPKLLSAAKAYVLCFCQKKGLPAPTETEINSIINSKCVTVRRGFKLAKI